MDLLERELEKAVISFLVMHGIFVFKPSKMTATKRAMRDADRGAPDIWVVHKGRAIALELKTKKGKLSDDQISWRVRFESAEGLYYVVRSLSDAANVLKAIQLI